MATVTLSKLNKVYSPGKKDSFHAVKGIDLEINEGEFMVLVGPSGCGKSTTLRMIAGLEDISGGTLKIGDQVVNDVQPKDRGIAMVFQNYALYPHMTLFDNMAFGLKLQKMPRVEIKQRVDEAAELLGLTEMLDRKPKALSGGQRQRVAVGRAIVRNPDVFLFDEPLSNLDAKMRVSMRTEISKLHSRLKATMVYVTHDQVEAMTMGDRICVMKDGNIMQVADPLTLYNRPDNMFVASFIGSPPMNLVNGQIVRHQSALWFTESKVGERGCHIKLDERLVQLAQPYEGRQIVLGFRPEDVRQPKDQMEEGAEINITAEVDISEPMGSETYLYLATGKQSIIARVNSHDIFKPSERVELSVDCNRVHFFDPDTERAIR